MKKFIVLLVVFSGFILRVRAQGRLGMKFSTFIPAFHIGPSGEVAGLKISGAGIRPAMALVADLPIGRSYYVATGAGYAGYPFRITYLSGDGFEVTADYKLQYVQVPLTLRMLTNEIAIDKRIYTQIGSLMEVLVYNQNENGNLSPVDRFNPVIFTFYIGAGVEFHLGTSTVLTVGLSYNRGISNLIQTDKWNSSLELKKDLYGLDLGIRF